MLPKLSSMKIFITVLMAVTMSVAIGAPSSAKKYKPKYAGIVIDANSGRVLYSRNADAYRYPASLTKMMTLYIVFEELKAKRLSKKSRIRMTKNAAAEQPSKLGIKPGRTLSVQQAIYALVTKSANDVATATGEHISGSEAKFAARMTRTARRLGMSKTTFKNAHGLPNRAQRTTARDMSKLGLALREHFPRDYRYFQTRSFKYGRRRYSNHNRLLGRVKGVDGIKTGYTRASGFNLVTSVSRGKRKIVAVVLGGRSGKARNAQMTRLIKRYLPKATRRKGGYLIAKARPAKTSKATVQLAKVDLPKTAPKPKFREKDKPAKTIGRVQIAHLASSSTLSSYNSKAIKARLMKLAVKITPLPVKKPVKIDPITTASVSKKINSVPTHQRPAGWHIQIGASPSKTAALNLLNKAKKRGKPVLASTSIYTETVQKGGATLHRARFTGFASKSSARRACRYLKKRKFACLALQG